MEHKQYQASEKRKLEVIQKTTLVENLLNWASEQEDSFSQMHPCQTRVSSRHPKTRVPALEFKFLKGKRRHTLVNSQRGLTNPRRYLPIYCSPWPLNRRKKFRNRFSTAAVEILMRLAAATIPQWLQKDISIVAVTAHVNPIKNFTFEVDKLMSKCIFSQKEKIDVSTASIFIIVSWSRKLSSLKWYLTLVSHN